MKLVVIEGLDGSGKETQTRFLQEKLVAMGKKVKMVSFPDYEKPWSVLAKMYLSGEFGKDPEDVNPYAASVFFAADRYASYKADWEKLYKDETIILCDRYTGSNAIYQSVKLPREEWDNFMSWLFDLEFGKMGLPKPDTTIYLKMHPETSKNLLARRYQEEGTGQDIHEADEEYLLKCYDAAGFVAHKYGWQVIECCDGAEPLPRQEVAKKLWQAVQGLF